MSDSSALRYRQAHRSRIHLAASQHWPISAKPAQEADPFCGLFDFKAGHDQMGEESKRIFLDNSCCN
jgi:hypothetical protein